MKKHNISCIVGILLFKKREDNIFITLFIYYSNLVLVYSIFHNYIRPFIYAEYPFHIDSFYVNENRVSRVGPHKKETKYWKEMLVQVIEIHIHFTWVIEKKKKKE